MKSSALLRTVLTWGLSALLIAGAGFSVLWLTKTFWPPDAPPVTLHVRQENPAGVASEKNLVLDPQKIGIVIVDMWDSHVDPPTKAVIDALVPRMNQTLEAARELGITNFFAISDIPLFLIPRIMDHRKPVAQALQDPDIPFPEFPGNSFFWPEQTQLRAPFERATSQIPPQVDPPPEARPESIHPSLIYRDPQLDLFIDPFISGEAHYAPPHIKTGWNKLSTVELYKTARARGITHLLFAGGGANQCTINRGFGAVNMKRLGFNVYLVRDLSFSGSSNGLVWQTRDPAPSVYPDRTHRIVAEWYETYFDGTVAASDILRAAAPDTFAYTLSVTDKPELLAYWRMSGPKGARLVQDLMNAQSAWNADSIKLGEDVPGITPDGDTAALFDGTSALIVAPFYRGDTPPESPLENLSAGSFSVEAWVRVDGGQNTRRWIITHDGGTEDSIDFLLGLDADNRFLWTTAGGENILHSKTTVTPEDISAAKLWHVVGIQDAGQEKLLLYVNGKKFEGPLKNLSRTLRTRSSLQIGSRGPVHIDAGEPGKGNLGKVLSSGHEFFTGLIDEAAIYGRALPASSILKHYRLIAGSTGQAPKK